MATTRRKWAAAAGALGAVAVVAALVSPAQAAAGSYVALGDSYSSGTGTGAYLDDGTSCLRSTSAYPSLIAASRGLDLNLRACSGATVADVVSLQLSALTTGTTDVTISVGGNDAGFADVLTECALPGWASDCDAAIDAADAVVAGSLAATLDSLYAQIASRAPQADVVVVGYPRIFMGEDCNALTFFSPQEEARLNTMADRVNAMTSERAAAVGFDFANPTTAFAGHAVCDDPEWLNGLSRPVAESYHPNLAGHQGYAGVVGQVLSSPAVGSPAPASQDGMAAATAAASSSSWAQRMTERQRGYAALDASVEPEVVEVPDLHSPAVLAAARAAGVDVDDPAEVAAVDARYSSVQEVAADRSAVAVEATPHGTRQAGPQFGCRPVSSSAVSS